MFSVKDWDTQTARYWMANHGYKPIKRVDITNNFYRYRLVQPNSKYNYKTITIKKSPLIKAIFYTN